MQSNNSLMNTTIIKKILIKSTTFLIGFLIASLLIDFIYKLLKSGDFNTALTYWANEISQPRKIATWIIISLVVASYSILSDRKK